MCPKGEVPMRKGIPHLAKFPIPIQIMHPLRGALCMAIGSEMLVPGEEVSKGGVREVSAE